LNFSKQLLSGVNFFDLYRDLLVKFWQKGAKILQKRGLPEFEKTPSKTATFWSEFF